MPFVVTQAGNVNAMSIGGNYPQSSVFIPPWGLPTGFQESQAAQMAAINTMPFLYPSYQPQLVQSSGTNGVGGTLTITNSSNAQTASAAVPGCSSGTVGHTSSSGCSTSPGGIAGVSTQSGTGVSGGLPGLGSMTNPFFAQNCGMWPPWNQAGNPNPFLNDAPTADVAGATSGGFVPNSGGSAGTVTAPTRENWSQAILRLGVSKKSEQRRNQRLAKKNFKLQYSKWPMTVTAAADGEIDPTIRLFVHKVIRATASRYLKLTVITFRDHPDEALRNLKEDLDKRFVFDANLRQNYVLSFLETAMKNVRYVFHRHWIDTGRGEKHAECSDKDFPVLVKYWKTKEAEKEIRAWKAERSAEKERLKTALAKVTASAEASDACWSVCLLPFYLSNPTHCIEFVLYHIRYERNFYFLCSWFVCPTSARSQCKYACNGQTSHTEN